MTAQVPSDLNYCMTLCIWPFLFNYSLRSPHWIKSKKWHRSFWKAITVNEINTFHVRSVNGEHKSTDVCMNTPLPYWKWKQGKKPQCVFKSQHKSPVISSNSSKNVKEFDQNYHHFALSNLQVTLETKEESCPKNNSREKELYKVYEGSLEAWGYLQNVILRCFRSFRPYHFIC